MPAPYKTIVICFDGTWNSWESGTNVSTLYSDIADDSTRSSTQRKFYDEGVGTKWYDRIRGGALGFGLDRNIRQGYAWLASVFECEKGGAKPAPASETRKPNGDLKSMPPHSSGAEFLAGSDIYIFGFSRGAFTARSLGGLVNYLGIPAIDPGTLEKDQGPLDHPTIKRAWELYNKRPTKVQSEEYKAGRGEAAWRKEMGDYLDAVAEFRKASRYPARIHFLGVWDTVGALGVPRVFDVSWIWRPSTKYQFHDTALCESVRNAFHAVAIDEHRANYKTTLWTGPPTATIENVEQRWFAGAHADVGGGYPDDLLHTLPLEWMAKKAASCGLEFLNDRQIQLPDGTIPAGIAMPPAAFDLDGSEYTAPVHDSYAEFLLGAYALTRGLGLQGRVYRRLLVAADGLAQTVDDSAFRKWKVDPSYRPPNLGQAGREDVSFARAQWDVALASAGGGSGD